MHRTRSPHYMEKPRSYRRDKYVSQRTEINADRHGQGVFRAYHYLPGMKGADELDDPCESFECVFLSHAFARDGLIYHADIHTVEGEARHFLRERVRCNVSQRLKDAGLSYRDAHGDVDFSGPTIIIQPDPPLVQFGGETVKTLYKQEWAARTPSECHHVMESFTVNRKRRYGAEFTAIVPYEGLTLPNVLDTIERFRQLEEKSCAFPIDWSTIDPSLQNYINSRSESGRTY